MMAIRAQGQDQGAQSQLEPSQPQGAGASSREVIGNDRPAAHAGNNYVKIVQRVPVKIIMDSPPTDVALGPGMSVVPSVRVDPAPSLYERVMTLAVSGRIKKRIFCQDGENRQLSKIHHGWVCSTDLAPRL